jgi:predicted GIY-YIG superfamily endonuclease
LFLITFHSTTSAYDQPMHEGSYCTYIMASRSHTLYVGITGDLLKRVFQHKWREHEGFTARYNCDRLVWFERQQDVHGAIAREKELKAWRECGRGRPHDSRRGRRRYMVRRGACRLPPGTGPDGFLKSNRRSLVARCGGLLGMTIGGRADLSGDCPGEGNQSLATFEKDRADRIHQPDLDRPQPRMVRG